MTEVFLGSWLKVQWDDHAFMFTVQVDGVAIACRGWHLQAVDRPAVILIHGFRDHARWWDHIAPSLAQTHRVVALDLSGMGDSAHREEYSCAQWSSEILAVAEACQFDRVTLISHSFGTIAGILAAKAAPERVARLIIIDAGLPIPGTPDYLIPELPSRIYPDLETAIERFRLLPPGRWPVPEILRYIASHALRETAYGWTWKFDVRLVSSLNRDRYRDELADIPIPVDIVFGDQSEIMTPARIAEAYRIAPHASEAVAIPACDHHVLIEQPIALVGLARAARP